MFSNGFLTLGRFGRAPVRIHWTTPIGLVVFAGLAPGAWLAFLLLVLIHEIGHALAVRRYGHRVASIEVHMFGGLCRWEGAPTPWERAVIAWGGVLAQAVIGAAAAVALAVHGRPAGAFAADFEHGLLAANLYLILFNLVPVPPLDGADAWGIVPILTARLRHRRAAAAARKRQAQDARLSPRHLDDEDALAPMPDEVKRVLDRVTAAGRAEHEAAAKKAK